MTDGCWVHTLQIVFEELEALGLSEPVHKPEPKKRGRKKKEPEVSKTKRSRGRPRKDANQWACEKTRVFSFVLLLIVIIIAILHKKGIVPLTP